MKKRRFKTIHKLDGTFLGKVKTIICKTQKGFDWEYAKHRKQISGVTEKPKVKVRPILNTEMLAVLDQGEQNA